MPSKDIKDRVKRLKSNGYSYVWKEARMFPKKEVKEQKENNDELFVEIFDELRTIQRKTTLRRFIVRNKDVIRTLNDEQKGSISAYIRRIFN